MRVALYARQVGTAAAFAPVLRSLKTRAAEVVALCSAAATATLAGEGPSHVVSRFEDANVILRDQRPDILVTGTSESVEDDAKYWAWASERGVPSIAFVDQWVSYGQRFSPSRSGRVEVEPDIIAVVDARAERRMREAGASAARLVVVGSPALDDLRPRKDGAAESLREGLLSEHQASRVALLATEPLPGSPDEVRASHGFTDLDCLVAALSALSAQAVSSGHRIVAVIRAHPRDTPARLLSLQRPRDGITILTRSDPKRAALLSSDIVLGMRSMLLLEAAFAGRPTVSVQLERKTESDLTDDREGIVVAESEASLIGAVRAALSLPWPRPDDAICPLPHLAGVERFRLLIESVASRMNHLEPPRHES